MAEATQRGWCSSEVDYASLAVNYGQSRHGGVGVTLEVLALPQHGLLLHNRAWIVWCQRLFMKRKRHRAATHTHFTHLRLLFSRMRNVIVETGVAAFDGRAGRSGESHISVFAR